MSKEAIISAKNIGIGYNAGKHRDQNMLYKNLSFNLYAGEMVCLLGANGAGKSTLLRTISKSQPILAGDIFLTDRNMTHYSEKELSQIIGLVLTDKTSTGGLLVRELVELGRYPYTGFFGQLGKYDKEVVEKSMADVGISHKANSYVAELSDGERQKVMIAKALSQECPIVLLDEPTAFLDIESRIEIMNLLHHLAMYQNKTILLSTHDIDMALLLSDRLWLLSREHGLTSGITEDIVLSGSMDHFFKGDNIIFNRNTGNFFPKRQSDRKVFIEADDTLYHWSKNMLERNDYSVAEERSDSLFILKAINCQSMSIQIAKTGAVSQFNNFEELASFLKTYNR
ncbi:ABC transporter ATP-binding protein [Dysgonomonas sp. BGC7]|uniref:ABC transporter ATP-binding protein n=1 Tax=Dysgonomonas sp. BGC7 TaxID=1658008 RepID=UPI0006831C58|nr:ABC transporter ATP-binding protein [Dysgonomonas sp. BGC7]MBD8388601.1 ABC transporter ATP-binding protein [Dysgonomonas sp. BGC7]